MDCRFSKNVKFYTEFLTDLLENRNKISDFDKKTVLNCFPFKGNLDDETILKNPNYLAIKLLRKLKINPQLLSEKLQIPTHIAEEILENPILEAKFPIANDEGGVINTALVIPVSERKIIFPDKEFLPNEVLKGIERVSELTSKGFFISFEYIPFEGQSFTMSLYAVLRFEKSLSKIALTGVLTDKGEFETVEYLEEKLKAAHEKGLPLVYAEKGVIENTKDLEEFLTDLKLPFSILLTESRVKQFEDYFRFKESYLRKVFNLKNRLHYTVEGGILPENKSSFENVENWVNDTVNEINQKILSKVENAKVVTAQFLLAPAFICGLKLSKAGIPVVFYSYDKDKRMYRETYTINDDKFDKLINPEEFFEIYKPKEVEEIYISTKSEISPTEKTFLFKLKPEYEKLPEDERVKGISQGLASILRSLSKHTHYRLKIEAPTSLAFGLGYYLEDYLNLTVYHKNFAAFKIGKEGNVYLTNTFSIAMLPTEEVQVNFKPIEFKEARKILETKNVISYISHQSTAQVLSELLKREISLNRSILKLKKGDTLIVFHIYQRPKERQVFSVEELKDILEKENYSFWKVEVLS